MTRYRVSWCGVARRRFAVERPADVLYLLWTQHREDMVPGPVTFDAAGGTTFPVAVSHEIEADTMHDADMALRDAHPVFDMGGDVTVEVLP
jgi:hypothetical protein